LILRLTDAAETDLAEIWAYIALEASEAIATRFVSAIKAEFDQLLAFPLSGPARNNLAPNLRIKPHGAYAIYYTANAGELVIVRVLHGARDVGAIADYGGFSA
jgi:toxin ParE1/3/4